MLPYLWFHIPDSILHYINTEENNLISGSINPFLWLIFYVKDSTHQQR